MRYDLLAPRKKKDGGTHWHKVGAAFPRDNGTFALAFDSLPLPDDQGKVYVLMSEAKGREDQPAREANDRPRGPDGFEDQEVGF